MKKGDRVMTPEGAGEYIGLSDSGNYRSVTLDSDGKAHGFLRHLVTPIDTPQVNAVVGEACEAILERLRGALGVASIGEVEGAVLAGRPRFALLTVAAIDAHDGEWLVQTRVDGMYLRARVRPGRYTQAELDETFAGGMPLDGDGQPMGVKA